MSEEKYLSLEKQFKTKKYLEDYIYGSQTYLLYPLEISKCKYCQDMVKNNARVAQQIERIYSQHSADNVSLVVKSHHGGKKIIKLGESTEVDTDRDEKTEEYEDELQTFMDFEEEKDEHINIKKECTSEQDATYKTIFKKVLQVHISQIISWILACEVAPYRPVFDKSGTPVGIFVPDFDQGWIYTFSAKEDGLQHFVWKWDDEFYNYGKEGNRDQFDPSFIFHVNPGTKPTSKGKIMTPLGSTHNDYKILKRYEILEFENAQSSAIPKGFISGNFGTKEVLDGIGLPKNDDVGGGVFTRDIYDEEIEKEKMEGFVERVGKSQEISRFLRTSQKKFYKIEGHNIYSIPGKSSITFTPRNGKFPIDVNTFRSRHEKNMMTVTNHPAQTFDMTSGKMLGAGYVDMLKKISRENSMATIEQYSRFLTCCFRSLFGPVIENLRKKIIDELESYQLDPNCDEEKLKRMISSLKGVDVKFFCVEIARPFGSEEVLDTDIDPTEKKKTSEESEMKTDLKTKMTTSDEIDETAPSETEEKKNTEESNGNELTDKNNSQHFEK